MSTFIKRLSLVLALLLVFPLLTACGTDKDDDKKQTDISEEFMGLAPTSLDFNNEKFTILCRQSNAWGDWEQEVTADEEETEIVNQAVYDRNLAVEEAYGVDIDVIAIPGHWTDADSFTTTFRTSILSGDGAFDILVGQKAYMATLANMELYTNMHEVPYVKDDLTSSYFYQDLINEITVNDTLHYLVGDYTISYMDNVNVMYFNKQIAENENLEDIYQLVRDGNWTIDKCIEMAKGVYFDVNGDGWPGEEDRFGYITDYGNTVDGLFSQFDIQQTKRDESGNLVADMDTGKVVSILEKLIEFFKTDDVFTYASSSSQTPEELPFNTIFTEDRALFYPDVLATAKTYRGMETDFGIIPLPKWNTQQQKYLTQAQSGYSTVSIPIDVTNLEKVGAVTDALFAKSADLVLPAYYDMALKSKFARDNESGEMIDIIREGMCINFGFFYDIGGGGMFRILLPQNNSNFASYYAANKKAYERNLKKVIQAFETEEETAE